MYWCIHCILYISGQGGNSEGQHKVDSKAVMESFVTENTDLYEMLQVSLNPILCGGKSEKQRWWL